MSKIPLQDEALALPTKAVGGAAAHPAAHALRQGNLWGSPGPTHSSGLALTGFGGSVLTFVRLGAWASSTLSMGKTAPRTAMTKTAVHKLAAMAAVGRRAEWELRSAN